MLINLSEVFTWKAKKTWEVPFETKAYKGP